MSVHPETARSARALRLRRTQLSVSIRREASPLANAHAPRVLKMPAPISSFRRARAAELDRLRQRNPGSRLSSDRHREKTSETCTRSAGERNWIANCPVLCQLHVAGSRAQQSAEHLDRGSFAGAVRSQQSVYLAV